MTNPLAIAAAVALSMGSKPVREHKPMPISMYTRFELEAEVERLRGAIPQPMCWEPMESAPKNASWVALLTKDESGRRRRYIAHFAEGGGEDQPRYGPGWFYDAGGSFYEVTGTPTHWAPLPAEPR